MNFRFEADLLTDAWWLATEKDGGHSALFTSDGAMITRSQWRDLRDKMDDFFGRFSDEEIEKHGFERLGKHGRRNPQTIDLPFARKPGHVYMVRVKGTPWYKIGQTIRLHERMRSLGYSIVAGIEPLHHFFVPDIDSAEFHFHKRFEHKRGRKEWFSLSDDDIEYFKDTCQSIVETWEAQIEDSRSHSSEGGI